MKQILLSIILFLSMFELNAQGCSDAGGCSVGSMSFLESPHKTKINVAIEQTFGLGEKFTLIGQTTAIIQYRLFSTTQLELRSPYIFAVGNLGSTAGVGDMIFSVTQNLFATQTQGSSLLMGVRLKSNNANFTYHDAPLPMAYQTSLGSNDFLTGLFYYWQKWDFYIAYQHAFNRNKNQYIHPTNESDEKRLYYESAGLKRGDDLYFRVQHTFSLKHNKNQIKATLLNIYRLQQDQIIKNDENIYLDDSKGLTLNVGVTLLQKLKNNKTLEWSLSFPVIDRKYRADGLTRNLVFSTKIRL